jgi:hypothetical protein
VVENAARISNSHFVTQRWLGGMLTNWLTIKNCIDNLRLFCDFTLNYFLCFIYLEFCVLIEFFVLIMF